MNKDLIHQLTNFGFSLFITWLVWLYYKKRTSDYSERYSTFWPRFLTGIVDSCVLWPLTFIISALFLISLPKLVAALLVTIEALAWLFYTVVMHARRGQTVGKIVTKVRVVDFRTEGKISWRQAWLREGIPMALNLGFLVYEVYSILAGGITASSTVNGHDVIDGSSFWFLVGVPLFWFLAEVLTMLTNKKRRALHDFIAGTVVVRTNTLESA